MKRFFNFFHEFLISKMLLLEICIKSGCDGFLKIETYRKYIQDFFNAINSKFSQIVNENSIFLLS